jgi:hypothetical protein
MAVWDNQHLSARRPRRHPGTDRDPAPGHLGATVISTANRVFESTCVERMRTTVPLTKRPTGR